MATKPGRGRALLPTLVVLGALAIAFLLFTGFYTEWRWFQSIDFEGVYTTTLLVRAGLFVGFGLLMAAAVAANMVVAYRMRPLFRAVSPEQASLERYRMALDPSSAPPLIVSASLLGLLRGRLRRRRVAHLPAVAQRHGVRRDRPAVRTRLSLLHLHSCRGCGSWSSFGFAVVILSLIAAVVVHYLYGGIRLQTAEDRTTPRRHGAHLPCSSASSCCSRRSPTGSTATSSRSRPTAACTGAAPTPTSTPCSRPRTILVVIALICAALFFVNVFRRTWTLPIIGAGLLAARRRFAHRLVYPAFVQQFQVQPQRAGRGDRRTSRATSTRPGRRTALDDVRGRRLQRQAGARRGAIQASAGTIENIRLLDPAL